MKAILLEFIDEAKVFLDNYGKNFFLSKNTLIVCLDPRVRVFLKENGIASKDTLDYLDNDAQHRIIVKTEELTDQLLQKMHLVDGLAIREGYKETCAHYLRFYVNHFLWIIEILKGIKGKHAVDEICCCLPEDQSNMYVRNAYIQERERFLGLLAEDFCRINKIIFRTSYLKNQRSRFFVSWVAKIIHKIGESITRIGMFLISKKNARTKMMIVPAFSYHMDRLLKEIKERHSDVRCVMIWEEKSTFKQELFKVYLLLSTFLKKLKRQNVVDMVISLDLVKDRIRKDVQQQGNMEKEFNKLSIAIRSELKDSLVYERIPFSSYLAEKIDKGLKPEILDLQHSTMVLSGVLKRLRPDLLMSMYSGGIYYMMGELSNCLGFSSLNISHGTHVPPNNEFERIENYQLGKGVILNSYQNVAVQTPWADKFLDFYQDKRPRVFSGPLLYSERKAGVRQEIRNDVLGVKDNMKIIVYATTQKARGGIRLHITETLDEYISTLTDIVNAVNELKDVYFVIRPHPACDLSEKEFRALLPACNRLKIMTKQTFAEILSITDLLISYSSTCIEEALQDKIPVVLYDKWNRYNHFNIRESSDAEKIERKPAYYFTDSRVLKDGINRILDIFEKEPLTDNDLSDYKYPKTSKANFFTFIGQALNRSVAS